MATKVTPLEDLNYPHALVFLVRSNPVLPRLNFAEARSPIARLTLWLRDTPLSKEVKSAQKSHIDLMTVRY